MDFPNIVVLVELCSYAVEKHTLALNQQWYPAQHKCATQTVQLLNYLFRTGKLCFKGNAEPGWCLSWSITHPGVSWSNMQALTVCLMLSVLFPYARISWMVFLILRLQNIFLILVGKSVEIRETTLSRTEILWVPVFSCQVCQSHLSVWLMVSSVTLLPFLTTSLTLCSKIPCHAGINREMEGC